MSCPSSGLHYREQFIQYRITEHCYMNAEMYIAVLYIGNIALYNLRLMYTAVLYTGTIALYNLRSKL